MGTRFVQKTIFFVGELWICNNQHFPAPTWSFATMMIFLTNTWFFSTSMIFSQQHMIFSHQHDPFLPMCCLIYSVNSSGSQNTLVVYVIGWFRTRTWTLEKIRMFRTKARTRAKVRARTICCSSGLRCRHSWSWPWPRNCSWPGFGTFLFFLRFGFWS